MRKDSEEICLESAVSKPASLNKGSLFVTRTTVREHGGGEKGAREAPALRRVSGRLGHCGVYR